MILNLYKNNQIKRILALCLVLVLIFTSFSDDFNKANKAQAIALVDDVTYFGIAATFILMAGVTFATTGDLQEATQQFLVSCHNSADVISDMASTVSDGVLNLSSDWLVGVNVIFQDIKNFFSVDASGEFTGVISSGIFRIPVYNNNYNDLGNNVSIPDLCIEKIMVNQSGEQGVQLSDYYDLNFVNSLFQSNVISDVPFVGIKDYEISVGKSRTANYDLYTTYPFIWANTQTTYTKNGVVCYKGFGVQAFASQFIMTGTPWKLEYGKIFVSGTNAFTSDFYIPIDKLGANLVSINQSVNYLDGQTVANNQDVIDATTSALTNGNVSIDTAQTGVANALTGSQTAPLTISQSAVMPSAVTAELEGVVTPPPPAYDGDYKVPTGLASKFPFDLIALVTALNATAEAPRFEIPIDFSFIGYEDVLVLDMHDFEPVAQVFRWGMLAIFILALILITRRMIGG